MIPSDLIDNSCNCKKIENNIEKAEFHRIIKAIYLNAAVNRNTQTAENKPLAQSLKDLKPLKGNLKFALYHAGDNFVIANKDF